MITVHQPPTFPQVNPYRSIFLAGSIEMGKAVNWQKEFIDKVSKLKKAKSRIEYNIFNPRRDDWDNSLEQSIENPQFYQQVQWELTYLERCCFKVFYFAEDTLSPITLLELGTFHKENNVYVCASPKYLRLGNLEIFTNRYNLPLHSSLDEVISKIFET